MRQTVRGTIAPSQKGAAHGPASRFISAGHRPGLMWRMPSVREQATRDNPAPGSSDHQDGGRAGRCSTPAGKMVEIELGFRAANRIELLRHVFQDRHPCQATRTYSSSRSSAISGQTNGARFNIFWGHGAVRSTVDTMASRTGLLPSPRSRQSSDAYVRTSGRVTDGREWP